MFKKLLILFVALTNSTFIKQPNILISRKREIPKFALINNHHELLDKIITPEFKETATKFIIKSMSNTLPQFDSISHIVLNTNNRLITYILEDELIPPQIKKNIILLTIKMTQEGDNMGGQILELYYNIVDKIL